MVSSSPPAAHNTIAVWAYEDKLYDTWDMLPLLTRSPNTPQSIGYVGLMFNNLEIGCFHHTDRIMLHPMELSLTLMACGGSFLLGPNKKTSHKNNNEGKQYFKAGL